MKETMTVEECAKILCADADTVRAGIKSGMLDIPYFMNGRKMFILTRRFYRDFLGADVESIRKMIREEET